MATNGDDTIIGTPGNDDLIGLAGNDSIFTRGGRDVVDAGDGDDVIYYDATGTFSRIAGGPGFDALVMSVAYGSFSLTVPADLERVIGSAFVDRIYATTTSTPFWFQGMGGNDVLRGSNGNDILDGGDNDDTLQGGSGADIIVGGAGNDRLEGDSGNDILNGDAGDDQVFGGDGDDILRGGTGADSLSGGNGNDLYLWELGDGATELNDSLGADVFRFGSGVAAADLLFTYEQFDLVVTHTPSGQAIRFDNQHSTFNQVIESIETASGTIDLTAGYTITGTGSGETLHGGLFRDTISGGGGNDQINGNAGDDTLNGDEGADTLRGGDGADILDGGSGNDSLFGGDGNDRLIGGIGDDLLDGDGGFDWAWYLGEISAVTVVLGDDVAGSATGVSIGTDTLRDIENVFGSEAGDSITGNAETNNLVGGGGNDAVAAGRGNDVVLGGAGNDQLRGEAGDDTIYGDEPFSPSQTASAAGQLPSGEPISISLTGARWDPDSTTTVTGYVGAGFAAGAAVHVAYVFDRSGSMSGTFRGGETVPDLNGDGSPNALIDGVIAGYIALTNSLIDAGLGSLAQVSLAPFDGSSSIVYSGLIGDDADFDGVPDIINQLRTIQVGGSTHFDAGLGRAIEAFSRTPGTANYVFLLSDGEHNGGDYTDEVASLINDYGATVRSIGLGDTASLTDLDRADDLLSNGSAERVQTPSQISASLVASDVDRSDVARVELFVNGSMVRTLSPAELVQTPLGLQFTVEMSGLSPTATDSIAARLVTSGPSPQFIAVNLNIDQVNPAPGGNDTIEGGSGNDVLYGNGGSDTIVGGSGNDRLIGGEGVDFMDGQSGFDTADYSDEFQDVWVNLVSNEARGIGIGQDYLAAIENAIGGFGSDTLIAHNGMSFPRAPDIVPGSIRDSLASAVVLDGFLDLDPNGDIVDSVRIPHATVRATGLGTLDHYRFTVMESGSRVVLDIDGTSAGFDSRLRLLDSSGSLIASGSGSSNDPGSTRFGDEIIDRTLAAGTYYVQVGANSSDPVPTTASYVLHVSAESGVLATGGGIVGARLDGQSGSDLLASGAADDVLDGGLGIDTAFYGFAGGSVVVDLAILGPQDTFSHGRDTLRNIENVTGSNVADILRGDGLANVLSGGGGVDELDGRGGNDTLLGGDGDDRLTGGTGNDLIDGGAGNDFAFYGGLRASYSVNVLQSAEGPLLVVRDLAGGDGIDYLRNVEGLAFGGGLFGFAGVQQARTANMDGGATDDVVFFNRNTGNVSFADMAPGGTVGFSTLLGALPGGWRLVDTGDINGDGWAEAIVQDSATGSVYGYSHAGGWQGVVRDISSAWEAIGLGDFTGDGVVEALLRNSGTGQLLYLDRDFGGGVGASFGTVGNFGLGWRTVGIGDFDRDGVSDVLIQNNADGTTLYAAMSGGVLAGFGSVSGPVGPAWQARAIADVDGDGFDDVVFRNALTGQIWGVDMLGGANSGWFVVTNDVGTAWDVGSTGDYDNDGYDDVAIRNVANGTTYVVDMDAGVPSGWDVATGILGSEWQIV